MSEINLQERIKAAGAASLERARAKRAQTSSDEKAPDTKAQAAEPIQTSEIPTPQKTDPIHRRSDFSVESSLGPSHDEEVYKYNGEEIKHIVFNAQDRLVEARQALEDNRMEEFNRIMISAKGSELLKLKLEEVADPANLERLQKLINEGMTRLESEAKRREAAAAPGVPSAHDSGPAAPGVVGSVDTVELERLRKEYIKAQKTVHDISGIKTVFAWIHPGSKETAQKALLEAEKNYAEARAEFVGTDVLRHMQERTKEVDERLALYKMQKENGTGIEKYTNKARRMWDSYKKSSARKYISTAGAVGTAFAFFGGMPVTGAIAVGYLGLRSLTAATSGIGTYDFLNMARGWGAKKFGADDIDHAFDLSSLDRSIKAMEVRAGMDGRTLADLQKDKDYDKIVKRYQKLLETEYSLGQLGNLWNEERENLGRKLGQERIARFVTGVAAAGLNYLALDRVAKAWEKWNEAQDLASTAGGAVQPRTTDIHLPGSWPIEAPGTSADINLEDIPSKSLIEGAQERLEQAGITEPEPAATSQDAAAVAGSEAAQTIEVQGPAQALELRAGASMDVSASGEAIIHAGGRGIEGALSDALTKLNESTVDADKQKYTVAIKWLHEQMPDYKDDNQGVMIHKWLVKYAAENNLGDIDKVGSTKDLSKILAADIKINLDGSLEIHPEGIKFMKAAAEQAHQAVTQTHEASQNLSPKFDSHVYKSVFDPKYASEHPSLFKHVNFDGKVADHVPNLDQDIPTDSSAEDVVPDVSRAPRTIPEGREVAARNLIENATGKFSHSLQLLLDKDSRVFTRQQFGVTPESLNKFKDLSVNEFLARVDQGKIDAKKFLKVYNLATEYKHLAEGDASLDAKKGFAKLILDSAKVWRKARYGV